MALWIAWTEVSPSAPVPLRFAVGWIFLVLAPGVALANSLAGSADRLERWILPAAVGLAASPLLAHALWLLGAVQWFPHAAAALGGLGLSRAWRRSPGPPASRPTGFACVACAALALGAGTIAYAHRVEVAPHAVEVRGDYDSYDSGYYAAMSAELAHHMPPQSPFRSGHALNYSWYPELMLAMIHRFGGVPLLDEYFRLSWPCFLITLAITCFIAVRRMATTAVAALATVLILLGSDFSYIAAVFWEHAPNWDDLVWSTNWMTPGAELLYYNPWTPALALMFFTFWAMRVYEERRRAVLLVASAMAIAVLMPLKPFAFAILMGGLAAAALVGTSDRAVRTRYWGVFALALVLALPWIVTDARLYADSQSSLHPGNGYLSVLPRVVTTQLGLERPLNRLAGGAGALSTVAGILIANLLFFSGGLGVRLLAIADVVTALRARRTDNTTWQLVAWTIVVGALPPLVVVTRPYHQTFLFFQGSLFLMWIFVAHAVLGRTATMSRRSIASGIVVVLLAVPSTMHYLHVKWRDAEHPFWTIDDDLVAVVRTLEQEDPDRTVVLHRFPGGASVIPVLSKRRVVLAWSAYAQDSAALQEEIDDFFHSPRDDCRSWLTLTRNSVTHVITTPKDHLHPAVLDRLIPIVTTPHYSLYRVPALHTLTR